MAFDTITTSFGSGQLAETMAGRIDTGIYNNGFGRGPNWLPYPEGGVRRRGGFVRLRELDDAHELMTFAFNQSEAYVVGLSSANLRVWDLSGQLQHAEFASPFGANPREVRWTQRADTMLLARNGVPIQRLFRTGATTFTFAPMAFETNVDGVRRSPQFKFADPAVTLSVSGASGSVTVSASEDVFVAGHVGVQFQIRKQDETDPAKYMVVEITAVTDGKNASGNAFDYSSGIGASQPTDIWTEEAISPVRGYPRAIAFHGQRLWLAGTDSLPAHFFGSKSGAFFNFDTGTGLDSDAIAQLIAQDQVNQVEHLASGTHLLFLTDTTAHYQPESDEAPITPRRMNPVQIAEYGADATRPLRYDDQLIWTAGDGESVQAVGQEPITRTLNHYGLSLPYSDWVYNLRSSTMWRSLPLRPEGFAVYVKDDGTIAVLHSVQKEEIRGWFPWTTPGKFHAVTASYTDLYATVQRTIGVDQKWFLEAYDPLVSVDGATFAVSPAEVPGSVFTDLTTHQGETVLAIGRHPDTLRCMHELGEFTVSPTGELDISPQTEWNVVVGYRYDTFMEMLPPHLVVEGRELFMEQCRVIAALVLVNEAYSLEVQGTQLLIKQAGDDFSLPTEPLTKPWRFYLLGWKRNPRVMLNVPYSLDVSVLTVKREIVF